MWLLSWLVDVWELVGSWERDELILSFWWLKIYGNANMLFR